MNKSLILAILVLSITLSFASAETYTFGSSWSNSASAYHSSNPVEYVKGPTYTYEPTVSNKISYTSTPVSYYKITVNPTYDKTTSSSTSYYEKHGKVYSATKSIGVEKYNGGYTYETNSLSGLSNAGSIIQYSQEFSSSSSNPTYYDAGYYYKQNPEFDYLSESDVGDYSSSSPSYFVPRRGCDGAYNWRVSYC